MRFLREFIKELDDPMPLPKWLNWMSHLLAQAFIYSLMIHLFVIVLWEAAFHMGMIQSRPITTLQQLMIPAEEKLQQQSFIPEEESIPLVFVDVDPMEKVEPPPKTEYYSNESTRAGNPTPSLIEHENSRVKGEEREDIKTVDKARQPSEPQEMVPVQTPPGEIVPQENQTEEDFPEPEFAKPKQNVGIGTPEVQKRRPRRLSDLRRNTSSLIGRASQLDGGVRRHSLVAQLDVQGTPFGNYDAAFIAAVQKRWYDLIDQSGMITTSGKVVVVFKLHEDGRITDLQTLSSTAGALQTTLCERAILDPAPYSPWPSELRRAIHGTVRDVKFTFYYR